MVLSDDGMASLKPSGLIVKGHIKIFPEKSDEVFKASDMISETASSLDME